ncbi:anti-sigma factor antagonist [Streptomyces sp. WAC05374]|uniref:STAS domain-containing protein n=1 Tax=Streptomyces sp. WAC05374 TaxID=2487420 RepID=UPI000F87B911|nr:STAS domain-containing protein [Streptomyces sp. WAC05374]RST17557.1 anti-sigma factor antagonist [Streptomyces sp. WAC05374]TDF50191.1 anti-sigma factor antagonist [Streptomyces sp. WAC05374]TDF57916.1 anti-sigma factor antagonist [Streptomyces sp. WAC05374]TDF60445.1 anti-sigma factor antagonist [Streptomyces sp. WAC05374]
MEPGRFQAQGEVRPTGVAVVRVSGELDYDGVTVLENAVRSVRALGGHRLLLDLSGLTFMDSSGVNALLKARQETHVTGGWMRIAGPQPPVLKVIELVGLDQAIPLYSSVGEALES